MKNALVHALLVVLLLGACCVPYGALAEGIIIIDEDDTMTLNVGEPFVADGKVELTLGETVVTDTYNGYVADSRNQLLLLPMHVMNLLFDDIRVSETVSVTLHYHEYSIDALGFNEDIAGDGQEQYQTDDDPHLEGLWHICYYSTSNKQTLEYDTEIKRISPVRYSWIDYNGDIEEFTWEAGKKRIVADKGLESYVIGSGVLGGGFPGTILIGQKMGHANNQIDAASDTLATLEESDYVYIFRAPNIVIRNLKECLFTIVIGDREYTLKL